MKKLDAFQIKIFLLVLMLLDHVYFAFPEIMPVWIHALTRGVAPMFAYFLVEGYYHTRNKTRYGIRLFAWAIFMQIGNLIINNLFASKEIVIYNNIFATLFVGFIIISIIQLSKNYKGFKKVTLVILSILITGVGCFMTEGGISVIPFIIITYMFRDNQKKEFIGYIILSIILFIMNFNVYPTFKATFDMMLFNSDFLLILSIPTILTYNGERGLNNKFSKYLFYVFYPLHIWGLALLEFIVR